MYTKKELKDTWEDELSRAKNYIEILASFSGEDDAFLHTYNEL